MNCLNYHTATRAVRNTTHQDLARRLCIRVLLQGTLDLLLKLQKITTRAFACMLELAEQGREGRWTVRLGSDTPVSTVPR